MKKNLKFKNGKKYIISLIHALGKDGRMRLRLKSVVEVEKLKSSYIKSFKIYLDNIDVFMI